MGENNCDRETERPALAGKNDLNVSPGTLAVFVDALNGRCGDLDAWLKCNKEAEVRAHVVALVIAEREKCAVIAETIHPRNIRIISAAIRNGG
jgi:hypothetical protein